MHTAHASVLTLSRSLLSIPTTPFFLFLVKNVLEKVVILRTSLREGHKFDILLVVMLEEVLGRCRLFPWNWRLARYSI